MFEKVVSLLLDNWFVMATTTATLSIVSANITNDVLNLNVSSLLTTDGTSGVDEVIGISRLLGVDDDGRILFRSADYPNGGFVYIKNIDSGSHNLLISTGTAPTFVEVGTLRKGEFAFFPWDADDNLFVEGNALGTDIEFALFLR